MKKFKLKISAMNCLSVLMGASGLVTLGFTDRLGAVSYALAAISGALFGIAIFDVLLNSTSQN